MIRTAILLACALMAISADANAGSCTSNHDGVYKCSHVELLGSLTRAEMGGDEGAYDLANDMWGWTDPVDGREYVIQGMYNGTSFIDVTDPSNPRYLGELPSPPATPPAPKGSPLAGKACHDGCGSDGEAGEKGTSSWQDVKVYGHHAYIVSEQDWFGMLIFDLHDLRDVTTPQTFTATKHVTEFRNAHNIFIHEETGYAYVIGNTYNDVDKPNFGGLLIYDLSDPGNPVQVADYEDTGYVHDVVCVNYQGPDAAYRNHEICFAANSGSRRDTDPDSPTYGNAYYLDHNNSGEFRADWTYDSANRELDWSNGTSTPPPFTIDEYSRVAVLDVTDKDNIVKLSDDQHPDSSYVHQSWPTEDHHYLFVNDEKEEVGYGTRTRSYTYDLSDLDAIEHVATYKAPNLAIDHNEYVKGRLLFQSNYDSGLRILDASDPVNLVEVGFFDSQPGTDLPQFSGTWSNYPYFESGTIPFSDISSGLFLVRHYLEEADELGAEIAVDAALLDDGSGEHTYHFTIANNGPGEADEIDATIHLPAGLSFITADGTDASCSAADRAVVCQIASLASCSTTTLSLTLADTADPATEIVGMASAKQLDPAGKTADNTVSLLVSDKQASVDPAAMSEALISPACASVPAVNAGSDLQATAGDVVNLQAEGTDELAPIVSYAWDQASGPVVSLTVTDAAETSFSAPDVDSATELEFVVTVENAYGAKATDRVKVSVAAKPSDDRDGGGGALHWLLLSFGILLPPRRKR